MKRAALKDANEVALCAVDEGLEWAGINVSELSNGVTIETRHGPARFQLFPGDTLGPWLAVQFDDVERARRGLGGSHYGRLNIHSGKWNWMGLESEAVRSYLVPSLRKLAPGGQDV